MEKLPILTLTLFGAGLGALAYGSYIVRWENRPIVVHASKVRQVRYVDVNQDGITDKVILKKGKEYTLEGLFYGQIVDGNVEYVQQQDIRKHKEQIKKAIPFFPDVEDFDLQPTIEDLKALER